jgi:hypothetical protein
MNETTAFANLALQSTGADDHSDTLQGATAIVIGGASQRGTIESRRDSDCFRVELNAGSSYRFELGFGSLSLVLFTLRKDEGSSVAEKLIGSKQGPARIDFTPAVGGTYYLDVEGVVVYGEPKTGTYTVRAVQTAPLVTPADDFPASTATSGIVTVNGPALPGAFESVNDVDWVRVDLRAGVLYQIGVSSSADGGPSGTVAPGIALTLNSPDGSSLSRPSKAGGDQFSFVAQAEGTYYLAINSRAEPGPYTVQAKTIPDDRPSSMQTTGVVQVNGAPTAGRIDAPSDTDYFKVELVGGVSYSFALAGTDHTPLDTYLRLRGMDGKELAANDNAGSKDKASSLTFQAPASGTYYLEASAVGGYTGNYKLMAAPSLSITQTFPTNGAANVPRSADITLTFDRPVQSNHGSVRLQTDAGSLEFSLDDASRVSINGRVVTINPEHDLAADTHYNLMLSAGALKDANGIALEGTTDGAALSFTTLAGNHAPTAGDHGGAGIEGNMVTGRLPAAIDADGDSFSYQLQDAPGAGKLIIEPDGRYTYTAPLQFSGADPFRFSVQDSQGGSNTYSGTITVAPMPVVQGTAQADTLVPATGSNRYLGLDGNDRISTGPGADVVDGGGGTDILVLSVPRSTATLQHRADGGWTIRSSTSGNDEVFNVERLQFTDRSTALDLNGTSGQVARVIGALFGPAKLKDAALVGRYLALADNGAAGEAIVHRALADTLFTSLVGSRSNANVVKLVYTNIVGKAPSAGEVTYYTSLITDGHHTQDSLLWWASSLDLTAQRIDLNGLANQGLDFLPLSGT